MISEQQMADMKRLADSAPKGPWVVVGGGSDDHTICVDNGDGTTAILFERVHTQGYEPLDTAAADFCCAARAGVPALIDAVAWRDRLLHDVQQDGGFAAGRASAFGEVLDVLRKMRGDLPPAFDAREATGRIYTANAAVDAVLALAGLTPGRRPELSPPEQVRAENERLREGLRKIIRIRGWPGTSWADAMRDVASETLGEER